MKKILFLSSLLLILSSCGNPSGLSCSQDDLNKKMLLVNATMGEYLQKNPDKVTEFQTKFQEISKKAALAEGPLDSCKMYDELLAAMK